MQGALYLETTQHASVGLWCTYICACVSARARVGIAARGVMQAAPGDLRKKET